VHQAFFFQQPLMSGGVYTTEAYLAQFLRGIINGTIYIGQGLGQNDTCAWTGCATGPNGGVASSPIVNNDWYYEPGWWHEVTSSGNGNDGSFSGVGAAGEYIWLNSTMTQYGVIHRYEAPNGSTYNGQNAQACALLIRTAWNTGIKQCGATPGTSC
jgi:hypothetical protein